MAADAQPPGTRADTLVLETDQSGDGFARSALGPRASVRLLYQRCREARAQSSPGQDYARLIATDAGDSFCFCVCDGVGSSYRGDFAARFLARRVVAWLHGLPGIPDDPEEFRARLSADLARWAAEAQALLLAEALPPGATGLVGEVLRELRAEYGGEAVFLAGRVETTHAMADVATVGTTADVEPQPRAILCSLGNVAGRVLTAGAWGDLDPADDRNRWSSARALRGQLQVRLLAPARLDRLIVYTDGAQTLRQHLATASDAELRERAVALLAAPGSDDVTILDIAWRPPAGESEEQRG